MSAEQLLADFGSYAGSFLVALIGSLLPLVSIEVFLVGLTLATGTHATLPIILLAATGQLLGKLPIYYAARGLTAIPHRRARIDRIRAWAARWHRSRHLLLATSAVFGLPPFSIAATAAGALAIEVRVFCVVVFAGRLLRFAGLIAIASLAR